MNATQNLALYCASAVLEEFPTGDYSPPLPPPGERAANTGSALTATVEPWRKLMYINMWLPEKFDEATQQAFASSMRVPTWDLQVPDFDPRTRSLVTMAAGPQFTIPPNHLPLPEGIQGVREWVYHLPLRTAERIMKLINKDSCDWILDINQATNQLSHLYTTCAWGSRQQPTHTESSNTPSRITTHLLFVVQSPWLLSPADFKMFCERSMYRHYAKKDPKTGRVEVTQLDYVDKLWATIYDDCVRGNTHYFVLTTYNQWAFGAFSRGWTTAWVTPAKPYNAGSASTPGPTILQSLLFWMYSAQQFSLSEQHLARQEHTRDVRLDEGLPTPISPTREKSPSESDFASDTDDNTLDKGWLNEMRTNVREIKDMKGAVTLSVNKSWVIPEVWEDMEPPRLPPKRTRPLDSGTTEAEPAAAGGWQHKRQRVLNDEHVTRRRPPSGRPGPGPNLPNHASPSSLQANSSFSKSVSSNSTCILPGGFPSKKTDASDSELPWISETSLVRIFWTRAFMSVRSTLADAFSRLVHSREKERQAIMGSPKLVTFAAEAANTRATVQLPERRFATLSVADTVPEEAEGPQYFEQEEDDGSGYASEQEIRPLGAAQSTIALGGHTIQLTSPRAPRLLSGIHLAQPDDDYAWPPPRRPMIRIPEPESSGGTEIDPDAQRRPECGYREQTPSAHANSIYEM